MATFTYLPPDQAPVTQQGVCTEYPAGYGGTPVHWVGPLSQIVAAESGVKVKVPEGFQPKRYVVKTEALAPHIFTNGMEAPTELVPGDSVVLTLSGAGVDASGTLAYSGTDGTPMFAGAVAAGAVVGDDATYVTVATSGTATLSGDVMVEALVYCDIVDPHPPKMF